MFTYSKQAEISTLNKELEKYQSVGNEQTVEELLANLSINKSEIVKKILLMLDEHEVNKRAEQKAYHERINLQRTKKARLAYKPLIEEYAQCMDRLVEIGEMNIIEANFSLNDYTEYRHIKHDIKKHLHMAKVGVERINRETI